MRRLLFAGTCLLVAGGAGAIACSFPNLPLFSDEGAGEASVDGTVPLDGATDGAAEDGSSQSDAAEDGGGEILIDGSSPDALIVQDAGQAIDAAGCAPSDCDCDKDTYKNTLKAGCSGGLTDCDDTDSRAHPNQGYLEAEAGSPRLGDWDCSGTPEPLFKTSVTCDALTLGLGCPDIFGFEDVPRCGQTGSFIRCKRASLLSLACTVGTRAPATQPCK